MHMNNISNPIHEKRRKKLHNNPSHPIYLLKKKIQSFFSDFTVFDHLEEVVSIQDNFDKLLVPLDHPARSPHDTYYVNENFVLRTQTSAHQNQLLTQGHHQFIVTGDVYRKDTIDKTHYPVFHQMEVVKILPHGTDALADLKQTLLGLIQFLYPGKAYRFLDDYFPFTSPSLQIEVMEDGEWMEVLGAGVIHADILQQCNIQATGWAFGLGLDRLVMSFCSIPDIRYFWSEDDRFLSQFKNGLMKFKAYSKFPPVFKDISFWVHDYATNREENWIEYNNLCEIIREKGRDLIESITLVDTYTQTGRTSLAYRIAYRSNERTLLNEEINAIQEAIRMELATAFAITLR